MSNENESERRAPGATRFPFEGLVEIGTSLGPAFEAQAVDVSGDGMHLRTAYLPELGQPITCRFDAGPTGTVQASGEVVWREEAGKGGECGIRFTDLDAESEEALRGMLEQPAHGPARVRLHIDGLGVAMKAKVRDSSRTKLTVGNDLGFLQVGKHLELEDAETGAKRPAHIARVELEIDPATQIPRLVVALRYEDEEASEALAMDAGGTKDVTPEPSVLEAQDDEVLVEDDSATDDESHDLKSSFARNAAKVTPAILALAKRAKLTAAMVWAKRGAKADASADENAPRRTTAPPPGGALHTAGRKVVRSEAELPVAGLSRFALKLDTKRKVAIGAAAGLSVAILFAALRHKPAAPPQVAEVATADTTVAAAAPPPPPAVTVDPMLAQVPPPPAPTLTMPSDVVDVKPPAAHKRVHVTPFSNGSVSHGTVLRLRMDGAIEKINGASQPTGFVVSIPGRKSIEPAGPLAARDSRIGSIKVSNDGSGAELDVNFKDGVPNYVVRARGDVLEVVLAAPGNVGAAPQAKATTTKPAVTPKRKPSAPHRKK